MTQVIHSRRVISITEFRKNPVECVNSGKGALAIMSRNLPAFYCVPAEEYGKLVELAEIGKKTQTN
ncbi:type II toxin-antitoxin system Phd/YefM family antitoxin [Buttiauxella agrestis]